MIADRRSQSEVCDRLRSYGNILLRSSAILRSRSQTIAEDRAMFYLLRSSAIICDPLRSTAIVRSYGNQSFAIRDGNAFHNISSSLPRFNARVFDCRNDLRSNTHFVVIMAEIEHVSNEEFMEEVASDECVYHRNSTDFRTKRTKRPTVGTKSGRSLIYRPGKRRPNFAT